MSAQGRRHGRWRIAPRFDCEPGGKPLRRRTRQFARAFLPRFFCRAPWYWPARPCRAHRTPAPAHARANSTCAPARTPRRQATRPRRPLTPTDDPPVHRVGRFCRRRVRMRQAGSSREWEEISGKDAPRIREQVKHARRILTAGLRADIAKMPALRNMPRLEVKDVSFRGFRSSIIAFVAVAAVAAVALPVPRTICAAIVAAAIVCAAIVAGTPPVFGLIAMEDILHVTEDDADEDTIVRGTEVCLYAGAYRHWKEFGEAEKSHALSICGDLNAYFGYCIDGRHASAQRGAMPEDEAFPVHLCGSLINSSIDDPGAANVSLKACTCFNTFPVGDGSKAVYAYTSVTTLRDIKAGEQLYAAYPWRHMPWPLGVAAPSGAPSEPRGEKKRRILAVST